MKKYLLPEKGTFYKANLHSHSTVSDGGWTPEEMKERYIEKGYSIIAFTDHGKLVPHNDLTDDNFLALNGLEYGVNNTEFVDGPYKHRKNCDICMIALEPDNFTPYHVLNPDFKMRYLPEVINELIQGGRDNGFFVTHNHPVWSGETYTDYMAYNNMNAMEICNFGCVESGFDEHNAKIYVDMLKGGKKLYCIATDDNHNKGGKFDSFGGFTMIKADKLEYREITSALVKGNFYASEGPIINELYYEDGMVHISSSDAQSIYITKYGKNVGRKISDNGYVNNASFPVEDDDVWFFITVIGPDGNKAYTNAYFVEDILK